MKEFCVMIIILAWVCTTFLLCISIIGLIPLLTTQDGKYIWFELPNYLIKKTF